MYINELDVGSELLILTSANSANSGSPFRGAVSLNVLKYTAAAAMDGSVYGLITTAVAEAAFVRDTISSKTARARISFSASGVPAADQTLLGMYTASNATRLVTLNINSVGKIRVIDATGASAGVFTATAAIAANTEYDVELIVDTGTTTSNGTIKANYYLRSTGALIEGISLTNVNAGNGAVIDSVRMGKVNAGSAIQYKFDHFAWDDAAGVVDLIGPWGGAAPVRVLTTTTNVYVVDARGSTGSSLTFGVTPTTGVTEVADGLFEIVRQIADVTYTLTITQAGIDYTSTFVVPAIGTVTGKAWRHLYSGSAWT